MTLPSACFHKSRAEVIYFFKRHGGQCVLRSAFYTCPHQPALFGAIRTRSAHIDENKRWILMDNCLCNMGSKCECHLRICCFLHANATDACTKKASIIAF